VSAHSPLNNKEGCTMRKTLNMFVVSVFCLALGAVGVTGAVAKSTGEILSNSEVTKIVEHKVGSDVLSISLHATKGGHYYYRVTVDNTPDDEVKDVYVNARTGQIVQVIEHPSDMILGEDEAG